MDDFILWIIIPGAAMLLIIGLAVWYCCFCKESAHEGPGYTVAMSNRLFKNSFIRGNQELPCQNCLFIEMGSMACYTETCPDCGRVPPSRSKEIKEYKTHLDTLRGRNDEMNLPPEDDMSTVPLPSSPRKTLGEVYLEKGI